MYLVLKRSKLFHFETRVKVGYLYNGYNVDTYYWEGVVIIRKMVMISLSTWQIFMSKPLISINLFCLFLIMLISHVVKQPYFSLKLNILEGLSIFALCISVYCGMFLLTDNTINSSQSSADGTFSISNNDNLILSILFIGSNCLFFGMLLVLAMIELFTYIRYKSPKIYRIITFLNDLAAQKEARFVANRKKHEDFKDLWNDLFLTIEAEWINIHKNIPLEQENFLDNIKTMSMIFHLI